MKRRRGEGGLIDNLFTVGKTYNCIIYIYIYIYTISKQTN